MLQIMIKCINNWIKNIQIKNVQYNMAVVKIQPIAISDNMS